MANHDMELTDAQLAEKLIKAKILSAGQLRAALDYQGSVGGKLYGVMIKLGLVREDILEKFIKSLRSGESLDMEEPRGPIESPIEAKKLRVHKKLLEKVPSELVDRYNILFFFPPPGTRAILMYSNPHINPKGVRKLRELLCVDICAIKLDSEDVAHFAVGASGRARPGKGHKAKTRKSRHGARAEPSKEISSEELEAVLGPGASAEDFESFRRPRGAEDPQSSGSGVDEEEDGEPQIIDALIQLLEKKGVVTTEELQVELQILKSVTAEESRTKRNEKAKKLVSESS